MNVTTLNNRIEKHLFTKKGVLADRYSFIADFLIRGKWYGKEWRSSGRWRNLSDTRYRAAIEICEALQIDFTLGNDAPRGGISGDYVALTEKGKRQVKAWVKEKISERKEKERIEAEKKAVRIAEGEKKVASAMEILLKNADFVKEWGKERINAGAFHRLAGALKVQNTNAFRVAVYKFFNPNHYYNPEYI